MKIKYSPKFARDYKKLPNKIKNLIEENEKIFLKNPFDKKLKTHKLSGKLKGFWSFSIDYKYRIIFEFADKDTIYLYSVGTHRIYQ
ncbi:type II toxin-antitoxin system mRNA interferase toxin, RelE/StbE family [Patescibacteria group bacterium]|nr:type II toxin-antitoxin system mRNA interferase toxin, RelE/StbE family [Patescibacteria group bacterium]MBU1563669.1 type II toxin-antitoxin system mRNA interferase toxin, RelE/StbE family [Patescibacteria group bacterium]MBU2068324.1 type II toxin-antitoxin system mRNA interferase toxin, RelE/StbE family [Patescibacteria group bacterium]